MKGLETQTRVSYPSPLFPLPSPASSSPVRAKRPSLIMSFPTLAVFHFVLFCFTTNKKKDCNLPQPPSPPPSPPSPPARDAFRSRCTELIKSMRIIGRTTGQNNFFSPPIYPVRSEIFCYCTFHKHANSEFKSQLKIAFFAAVNHLNGPLRKQNFTLMGSKGHGL